MADQYSSLTPQALALIQAALRSDYEALALLLTDQTPDQLAQVTVVLAVFAAAKCAELERAVPGLDYLTGLKNLSLRVAG